MSSLHHLTKRVDTLFSVTSPRQNSPDTRSGVFICPVVNGELIISAEDQARYQAGMTHGMGCVLLPEKDMPV